MTKTGEKGETRVDADGSGQAIMSPQHPDLDGGFEPGHAWGGSAGWSDDTDEYFEGTQSRTRLTPYLPNRNPATLTLSPPVDLSSFEFLTIRERHDSGTTHEVSIGLSDGSTLVQVVAKKHPIPQAATPPKSWNLVSVPLADYDAGGVDLTAIAFMSIIFFDPNGPSFPDPQIQAWIDDLRVEYTASGHVVQLDAEVS